MNIEFSIVDIVPRRTSVRNFSSQTIEPETMHSIESFVDTVDNPFGRTVRFYFLDAEELSAQPKLGTYGVIKGATRYIGASIDDAPFALEALGYEMETVILYLTSLGLGTCWLGGTFSRKAFARAMDVGDSQLFPAITPYGWSKKKKHAKEHLMRKMIRADQRKPWDVLFFQNDFDTPLTKKAAGELAFLLDMVRLGPSASNKQPWRVLLKDHTLHFFEAKQPGYSDAFAYDIQRIDMGIAAAHLDLAAREKGIRGEFDFSGEPALPLPDEWKYAFSWRAD